MTIAPVAPVYPLFAPPTADEPIPAAPLPQRCVAVAEHTEALAAGYAGTRGFLAVGAEWTGRTDATALARLDGGITLLYEAGAPDVAHDWGRITASVACGHDVQHQSDVTGQRDLDHLVAEAMVCDGHQPPAEPDLAETQPINILRPVSTGDLAMDRLVAWSRGRGERRRD